MAYAHENTVQAPRMTGRDVRNTMRNAAVAQVAQDPMDQMMQQLQMAGQVQELEQSPLQMALRQLQLETGLQNLQQGAEMFPYELAYRKLMADPNYRRAYGDEQVITTPGMEGAVAQPRAPQALTPELERLRQQYPQAFPQ